MATRGLVGLGTLSSEFPFLNFFKLFRDLQAAGGYAFPAVLDDDGYPVGTITTAVTGALSVPVEYTGRWVIKWTGSGFINLLRGSPGFTVHEGGGFVNGSTAFDLRVQGTNPRVVFSTTTSPVTNFPLQFPTGTYAMSNAILCREDDEEAIDNGDIWNPDYLAKLADLNPRILRMMDYTQTNGAQSARWPHLAPLTSFAAGRIWPNALWAGTISGTDTYTCGPAPDTPAVWTDGEFFQAQVTNANTSTTPTINVDGRGAKTIINEGGGALGVGNMSANQLATFRYDALLDQVIWLSGGLRGTFPISLLVNLANTLGFDIWLNVSGPSTDDDVTAMATYLKANVNPGSTVYIEYWNEVWNFAPGFAQTNYVRARAAVRGIPDSSNRREYGEYAKRMREVMGIFTDVWDGATAPRLRRVCGIMAHGDSGNTTNYRLEGDDLGPWGFNVAPDRPVDYIDVIAYAYYFSGAHCRAFQPQYTGALTELLAAADDYDSGEYDRMEEALDFVDDDIRHGAGGGETLEELITEIYPRWNTVAATFGKSVIPYEGGLEITHPTAATLTGLGIDTAYSAKIEALFTAYKRNWRCRVMTAAQMSQFMSFSQSEMPGWYLTFGGSQWSLFEGDLYTDLWEMGETIKLANSNRKTVAVKAVF